MYLQVFYPWIKISKSIGDVLLKKMELSWTSMQKHKEMYQSPAAAFL